MNKSEVKRVVFKFGTNILRNEDHDICLSRLYSFIEDIAKLYREGIEVLIVTSGAVGLGVKKLGMDSPQTTVDKQAAASIGQPMLIGIWQDGFDKFGINISQILLIEDDFSVRKRYLSLRSTLSRLLEAGIIPVINQNDVILPSELEHVSFSDNDKLSALVASKLDADLLVMVSDIDGLFDKNPKEYKDAVKISVVNKVTPKIEKLASGASMGGRGGMITKLNAAKVVTNSGAKAMIVNGLVPNIIRKIFEEENVGTLFLSNNKLSSKQRWIAYATNIRGEIVVNEGAKTALIEKQKSLLSVGMVEIKGTFEAGEVVGILDDKGIEFARGVTNYNSKECECIKGKHSFEIKDILGYMQSDDVINKDNLVIL